MREEEREEEGGEGRGRGREKGEEKKEEEKQRALYSWRRAVGIEEEGIKGEGDVRGSEGVGGRERAEGGVENSR